MSDESGASLADVLRARVKELRDAHLNAQKIAAQEISERMTANDRPHARLHPDLVCPTAEADGGSLPEDPMLCLWIQSIVATRCKHPGATTVAIAVDRECAAGGRGRCGCPADRDGYRVCDRKVLAMTRSARRRRDDRGAG